MANAFNAEAIDRTARQFTTVVSTDIFDRIKLAINVVHRNRGIAVEYGIQIMFAIP